MHPVKAPVCTRGADCLRLLTFDCRFGHPVCPAGETCERPGRCGFAHPEKSCARPGRPSHNPAAGAFSEKPQLCKFKHKCRFIGTGKCTNYHPDCQNGPGCAKLATRSCAFRHPKEHYNIALAAAPAPEEEPLSEADAALAAYDEECEREMEAALCEMALLGAEHDEEMALLGAEHEGV